MKMGLPVIPTNILSVVTVLMAVQSGSVNSQFINEIGVLQTRLGRTLLSAGHNVDYVIKPSDTNAVVNGTATLYCKINSAAMTSTSVKWFCPPNYHFCTEGRNSGHPRYSVTGGEEEYNLFINPVQPEDEGMFRCWVRELRGEPAEAMLTVLTQTGAPVITGYSNPVREGDTLALSCTSRGGHPRPILSWSLGSVPLEADTRSADVSEIGVTFRIQREHHGQVVTCIASQPGYPQLLRDLSTQITLEVQYAPSVSIVVSSPEMTKDGTIVQVKEGNTVTIKCNVESNPPSSIEWHGPRSVPLLLNQPELHISTIARSQNGTFICTAANSIASTSNRTTVDVLYPPKILTNVQHRRVMVGSELTLKCVAEGNPAPTIFWSNHSNGDILLNPLVVPTVSYTVTGKYICNAVSTGFDRLDEEEVFIEVTGKPVIVPGSDIVYAEVGSGVELRCNVEADPPINGSYWSWTESDGNRTTLWSNNTKDGFDFLFLVLDVVYFNSEKNLEIEVFDVTLFLAYQVISARGIAMVLAIDNIMLDDFRRYQCTATNTFGQDSRRLTLQPTIGTTSLSLPLLVGLGCSACVVCVVFVYFMKRYCHLVNKRKDNDQAEIDLVVMQPLNGTTDGHAIRLQSTSVSESARNLPSPVGNARRESQDMRAGQERSNIQRQPDGDEVFLLLGADTHGGQSEVQRSHSNKSSAIWK
ncbi:kin of IRRE-like protein 3 [Branchiostoma floridae x Branchiostoma japonicum]